MLFLLAKSASETLIRLHISWSHVSSSSFEMDLFMGFTDDDDDDEEDDGKRNYRREMTFDLRLFQQSQKFWFFFCTIFAPFFCFLRSRDEEIENIFVFISFRIRFSQILLKSKKTMTQRFFPVSQSRTLTELLQFTKNVRCARQSC